MTSSLDFETKRQNHSYRTNINWVQIGPPSERLRNKGNLTIWQKLPVHSTLLDRVRLSSRSLILHSRSMKAIGRSSFIHCAITFQPDPEYTVLYRLAAHQPLFPPSPPSSLSRPYKTGLGWYNSDTLNSEPSLSVSSPHCSDYSEAGGHLNPCGVSFLVKHWPRPVI